MVGAIRKHGLTLERVRELLEYNEETGDIIWRIRVTSTVPAGAIAGGLNNGYISISIDNISYYAHHIAWFLKTGKPPSGRIDHRNGKKNDNRWNNLREATHSQNKMNMPERCDNRSGFKGVTVSGKKFKAQICADGVIYYLGRFDTPEQASDAYKKKSLEIHGDFSFYARDNQEGI